MSSSATLAAVLVALWVAISGPRPLAKPKLRVSVEPVPPDCMWLPGPEPRVGDTCLASGHYVVRLRISNEGKEDARDVEVMMIGLWVIDDVGKRLEDPSFLPLLLPWSWWIPDSGPVRWLERLPARTFKHCDLLAVTLQPAANPGPKRRRFNKKVRPPQPWMTFQPAYDPARSPGRNPLSKPPGRYQLDFVVAASNATAIRWAAHINFTGWLDNPAKMFGEAGGLHIKITESGNVR